MNKQFDILRKTRTHLIEFTNDLTLDQLNEIPTGFNNNIAWNLAHLVASQQGLCYMRAGVPLFIEAEYFDRYKPGTRPETWMDSGELDLTRQLLLSAIDRLEADYQDNVFSHYTTWTNRYGIELSTIDEVISYVIFHEGLHLGAIMALKRLVKK